GGGGGRGGGGRGGGRGGDGGGMRASASGPGGNFFMGQQNGVTITHAIGGQYSDALSNNLNVEGSYFFNRTENHREDVTTRQYFVVNDTNQFYNENGTNDRNNVNHRLSLRMEYAIDSSNSLIFSPRMSAQLNSSSSRTLGQNTILQNTLQNQSLRLSGTDVTGYTSSNALTFRHKYELPGRSISFQLNMNANDRQSDGASQSWNTYYAGATLTGDTLNQKINSTVNGYGVSGTVTYTEPLAVSTLFQVNYTPSYTEQSSDRRSNDYDATTGMYDHFNRLLSNTLKTQYTTHSGGVGLQFREGEINAQAGLNVQHSSFTANRIYPNALKTEKTFDNLLPTATMHWRFDKSRGLQFLYRTSTNPPSVTQLENTVDNTNPLLLSTGNPGLQQYYTHSLTGRYNNTNVTTLQSVFLLVSGSYTMDYIGNATYFAAKDSVLDGGVVWKQGAQLSKPVNLGDQKSLRTMVTYGTPVDLISSNAYLNIGYTVGMTPSTVNGSSNTITSQSISPGISLNSNISKEFDCMLAYNANFNRVRNTAQADYDYFSHTATGRLQWTFWEGFTIRTDVKEQYNRNAATNLRQDFILWNMSIGKKLFSNDRGEITLQVFDLLNQNKNVTQSVEDTYIEEQRTNNLNQYFLLTFSYRLSGFQERPPDMHGPMEHRGPPMF
ncbi:MAG: outer membrane beta-barrel protein, partial [Ignavibacteriales bacterium]|nr:outer membrane beta-barrel protein [Ignavibacteriales bacterium]